MNHKRVQETDVTLNSFEDMKNLRITWKRIKENMIKEHGSVMVETNDIHLLVDIKSPC